MKLWQKSWLIFLIFYSSLHIVRDIFQDLRIQNILSTTFVKTTPLKLPLLWVYANTYMIAFTEILISIYCLKKRSFGKLGYLTIIIALSVLSLWTFYWFFL